MSDTAAREARQVDIREAVRSLVWMGQTVSLTGCNQEERDVLAHRSWRAIKAADALAAELAASRVLVEQMREALRYSLAYAHHVPGCPYDGLTGECELWPT